jgi:hypothetical protein
MKYCLLNFFCLILLLSCTKSTDINNPQKTDSTLSKRVVSVTEEKVSYFTQSIYSQFSYDQNNQLASMLTRVSVYPGLDTFLITFNLSGANNPPVSYDYTWYRVTNLTNAVEHHVLLYDDQKRVILDSMEYGTTTSGSEVYLINTKYIYNPGYIVAQHYTNNYETLPRIYGPSVISIDSMYLSNGNLTQDIIYYIGDSLTLYSNHYYTPTTYKNPLYQKDISNSLGILLCHNSGEDYFLGDFLSPNFTSAWGTTNNLYTVSYATDSTGNITKVSQEDIAGGYLTHDINFLYQ